MLEIRLEPFAEKHLSSLRNMLTDPEILRFSRVPEPVPDDFERHWFSLYEQGKNDGTRDNFAIVDAHGNKFLGVAVAPHLDLEARTAELVHIVAPWARGRGVATEALRRLTAWSFEDVGMVRLQLLISVNNDISKRVAQRCGHTLEGVLRSLHFKQDLRVDTESWSRLASDPAPS